MKTMGKKLAVLLMTVLMAAAMSMAVCAANEPTSAALSVNDSETKNEYTAYQVMTSKVAGYDAEGTAIYVYTVTDAFKNFFTGGSYSLNSDNEIVYTDNAGAKTVIATDGLSANTNSTDAAALASALAKYARENNIAGTRLSATLDIGYFVIAETKTASGIASKPILVDLRDTTVVTPKDSDVDLEKKIVENNAEVDANNVSIGDTISYKVTSNIPVYEADVDKDKLTFTFVDTFTHIGFNNDLTVTAGDAALTKDKDYTLTVEDTDEDGQNDKFTLVLTKETIYAHQGKAVTLTYSGILLSTAVIDSKDGNPNNIELTYTSNPNVTDGTGTLEDEVTTYTYGFKIHKVDKNDDTKDMAGAQFEIKNEAGTVIAKFEYDTKGAIKVITEGVSADSKIIVTTDGETGVTNYAVIKGLDEGTYTITETAAPQGYSLLGSDVVITITDTDEAGKLDGIAEVKVTSGNAGIENTATDADGNTTTTLVDSKDENGNAAIDVVVNIKNVKGISLPETGARTMMYCLFGGAAMILLGGLYFALTRRKTLKLH